MFCYISSLTLSILSKFYPIVMVIQFVLLNQFGSLFPFRVGGYRFAQVIVRELNKESQ